MVPSQKSGRKGKASKTDTPSAADAEVVIAKVADKRSCMIHSFPSKGEKSRLTDGIAHKIAVYHSEPHIHDGPGRIFSELLRNGRRTGSGEEIAAAHLFARLFGIREHASVADEEMMKGALRAARAVDSGTDVALMHHLMMSLGMSRRSDVSLTDWAIIRRELAALRDGGHPLQLAQLRYLMKFIGSQDDPRSDEDVMRSYLRKAVAEGIGEDLALMHIFMRGAGMKTSTNAKEMAKVRASLIAAQREERHNAAAWITYALKTMRAY